MSSGRKEKPTKDLIMLKPGLRAQIPASPSLSIASASSRRPLHYINGGYDSPDSLGSGHDYEELGQYQNVSTPRKQANVIYESTPSPLGAAQMGIHRQRQMTESSDDSTSTGSLEQYHHSGSSKRPHSRFIHYFLAFIALVSFTSLVLVLLMVYDVVSPKCSQCQTLKGGSTQSLTKIQQPSAKEFGWRAKIEALEKNVSSLLIRDVFMMALLRNHERQISELQKQMEAMKTRMDKESQPDKFKNITNEVRELRTKQHNVDNILAQLRSNDQSKSTQMNEIDRKLLAVAVSVNYLALNDSLIKSKVSGLVQSDSEIKAEIATLKTKDAGLDGNLKSLRARDSAFNASVQGLKSVDVEVKAAISTMNATVDSKINDITRMFNQLKNTSAQQGPPGPQGPQGPQGQDANFAGCTHEKVEKQATSGITTKADATFIFKATDKVVLGATCSTKGGDETNLSVGKNRSGQTVYVCECLGKSTSTYSSGPTTCRIDYWLCPKS